MEATTFRTSSFCTDAGQCVEVSVGVEAVRVRHTDAPGDQLVFTPGEWAAFVVGAKAGEFDPA